MPDAPLPLLPHEERLAPRLDLWVAATFLLIGLAVVALSFGMPTYRNQGGEPYTAPGLVPAFYGTVIALLSLWLALRSVKGGALAANDAAPSAADKGNSTARFVLAAGLGLFFIVGLIGRMPFWLAAAIFVALFVAGFEWPDRDVRRSRAKILGVAIAEGLATGILVTLVFEKIFLVRLP